MARKWVWLPLTVTVATFVFLSLAAVTDSVPVIVRQIRRPFVTPPPQRLQRAEIPIAPEIAPTAPRPPVFDWQK